MTHSIPQHWREMKLGSLFEFKNGVNAGKASYGSGIKFINVMEIVNNNFLNHDRIPGRVELNEKEIEKNLVTLGDVLFNRTSETPEEIGLTAVYLDDKPVVFGGFVIRARPLNKDLDNNFKKYCFSSPAFRKEVVKNGQGAVRSNIGQGDLSGIHLLVPPLLEQRRIAAVLETWERSIEKLERKTTLKKNVKKELMQKLLTGKIRLSGFTTEWEMVYFGSLFKERRELNNINLPLLSITSDEGVILQSDSNKKDTSNQDKSKYKKICPGDIGYNTMRMWQGRSALSELEGIVSPAYTILIPNKTTNSVYFSYLFKLPRLAHLFLQQSQGLVSDTLNCKFKDFAKVRCLIPSFSEQTAIANIFTKTDQEIAVLEKELALIKKQKNFLLNHLISGRIRTPENMPIPKV